MCTLEAEANVSKIESGTIVCGRVEPLLTPAIQLR